MAAVIELAEGRYDDFEFQRLHGMGENLYRCVMQRYSVKASLYAPIGPHEHLLAYLVRRLLENGANSSFVHKLYDRSVPAEDLSRNIIEDAKSHNTKRHISIRLPSQIYSPRMNATGYDLSDEEQVNQLIKSLKRPHFEPALDASDQQIETAFSEAEEAFTDWSNVSVETRSQCLETFANLLETRTPEFLSLLVYEAKKTIPDSVNEIREAVDFCRYYASQARHDLSDTGIDLPSPTGETNRLTLHGKGVFVCISPWNFPLAIFTGQVVAALVSGNTVIAKPAEQTPHIALKLVEYLKEAGIPSEAIHCLIGDGAIGAKIIAHQNVSGVAFTGSTEVARLINRSLRQKTVRSFH